MPSRIWSNDYIIYTIVFLIGLLLVTNIYLIYKNNQVIEYNRSQFDKAEQIKVNTVEITRNLHLLDMALRSFALVKQEKYLTIADNCITNKDVIFSRLEEALREQHYPMRHFFRMRDSVNAYYQVINVMKENLVQGNFDTFIKILEPDPGYKAWTAFEPFAESVNYFETSIGERARAEYQQALKNSYLLQIALFFIAMPTLGYTAYYTTRALKLSDHIKEQNSKLEQTVKERTKEIEFQRNELRIQNEELRNAKLTIEQKNAEIQSKHDELAVEVDRQTQDLKKTNLELIEHNSRLEQFTYIISHNLRAPMARLTGLASLLKHCQKQEESNAITQMMIRSSGELDQVVRDLSHILGTQKSSTQLLSEVNLKHAIDKVATHLNCEIKETGATFYKNLEDVATFNSLPSYVESILYNLMSNAIKYRHPRRTPIITLRAKQEGEFVRIDVADNGVGIDVELYKDRLFQLYKRFHFHVEGKGLGLFLVKTQVSALGGKIEVRSKVEEGTTFTVFLKSNLS
jgi:signal transduction histidine kinase